MQAWYSRLDMHKLERLFPLVFLLLLLWLCWRLANVFWWIVAPPQIPVVQSVILGSQKPVMPNIVRFALFDEPGQNPQALQNNLPIQLVGVVLATPSYLSSAVLRIENQGNRYRVGETIAETDMQLSEVYWDKVILIQNGARKEIKFGEKSTTANVAAPSYTLPNANKAADSQQAPASGNVIDSAIEKLHKDREHYLNEMGVAAQAGGLAVTDKTPPAVRARLGLQPGDKVVSVNGQAITAATNEAQLLEQIKKTGQAKIEIQRGDQTMTIQQNF